jgi:hypothetical protein
VASPARMIAMSMRDNRMLDRQPRVDVKTADRRVETTIGSF